MRTLLALSIVLSALALLPFGRARGGPPGQRWEIDEQVLLFHGVLEGLYADGVSNEVVDAITELDEQIQWPRYFIYACPVCMPAFNACRVYRARPSFLGDKLQRDTFGEGLSEEVRARLLSDDPGVRLAAIREQIKVWISRRLDSLRLTTAERTRIKRRLEGMRKKGLSYLQQYSQEGRLAGLYDHMEYCPFCDGANDAAEH